jgi:23S rRNA pseudouridine1911/1915/1917 synthase
MELAVAAESAGERLDVVLGAAVGSRARAQRLIADGRVLVDGAPAQKADRVVAGARIVVADAPAATAAAPAVAAPVARFAVAYEDDDLIVVDKPAGVVVHPARGHREGTLAQALAGRAAGGEHDWRAGIVHRLVRDTSGLLVVAKSDAIHRALKAALQARDIRREYLALVEGRPPARSGTIEAPIGRDRRHRTRMSIDSDLVKPAITHFHTERALPRSTLLRVRLQTGRTHQIRVHLQSIGHPVCGDPDYGHKGLYGLGRQFLHAARLAFAHPRTGIAVDIVSPLPEDLEQALARAAGEADG